MKISTNIGCFKPEPGLTFTGLNARDSDCCLLFFEQVVGNASIPELRETLNAVRELPPSLPCVIVTIGTKIPSVNRREFSYYASKERDGLVRALTEEVLRRSAVIGVDNETMFGYFTEFLGFPADRFTIMTKEKTRAFLRANGVEGAFSEQYAGYSANSGIFRGPRDETMTIGRPYIIETPGGGGNVRLCSDITANHITRTLWLEADVRYKQYLCTERCDAFLIGSLCYALKFGHDIVCEAPVTEQLLHNLVEVLIPSLVQNSEVYRNITITAAMDATPIGGAAVGTGMSGGVDSFYSVALYQNSPYPSMSLTHLYTGNYLYGGAAKELINNRAVNVARELNLPLVNTDTNITEFFALPHLPTHAYKTLFGVFALRKLWKIYYYSSTYQFNHFTFRNLGKEYADTASYDLLLCHALSLPDLTIYSGGAKATRLEKTCGILSNRAAQKYLNVCLTPRLEQNCGDCGKCVRTLLSLDALGALDDFREAFDIDHYRQTRLEKMAHLVSQKDSDMLRDVYEHFARSEPETIRRAETLAKSKPR